MAASNIISKNNYLTSSLSQSPPPKEGYFNLNDCYLRKIKTGFKTQGTPPHLRRAFLVTQKRQDDVSARSLERSVKKSVILKRGEGELDLLKQTRLL